MNLYSSLGKRWSRARPVAGLRPPKAARPKVARPTTNGARRRKRFLQVLSLGALRLTGRRQAAAHAAAGWRASAAATPAWQPVGQRVFDGLRSPRLFSLVLLITCLSAFGYAVNDEGFFVSRPEVVGRHSIPLRDIHAMTGVVGLQLFWIDPLRMAAALEDSPSIADAHVEVGWPNRVRIVIEERVPVLVWQQAGAVNWVDGAGKLMPARGTPAEGGRGGQTLLTIVVEGNRPQPENARQVDARIVQAALALRTLRPNIDTLNYFEHGGLEYNDGRGWQAFFGTGADMAQKLAVYETLVEYLLQQRNLSPEQIEYIVVTDVKHPFYKVRGE